MKAAYIQKFGGPEVLQYGDLPDPTAGPGQIVVDTGPARVSASASAANLAYVRGLGADEVIDYNATDFRKVVSNCDAVFDTVGGEVATRSFAVLKPGGRAAFIASGAQAPKPDRSDVASLRPAVGRDRAHLERIVELYEKKAVRVPPVTE